MTDSYRESDHAKHILLCIDRLQNFLAEPSSRQRYSADWIVQNGVLRALHTMSESTQHLPSAFKQQHAHIPWREIAGFRNVLVHGYLGELDVDAVWGFIENDLPPLKDCINVFLKEHLG